MYVIYSVFVLRLIINVLLYNTSFHFIYGLLLKLCLWYSIIFMITVHGEGGGVRVISMLTKSAITTIMIGPGMVTVKYFDSNSNPNTNALS